MVVDPGAGVALRHSFDARTKCCTFTPTLANYLVGHALRTGGRGARSVRGRLHGDGAASPLGLRGTIEAPGVERFGRDPSLLCPHYEDGACSIWASREATCATWFCKHTRGAVGKALWNWVEQLLRVVERAVARHAALELGIPAAGLALDLPLAASAPGQRRHDRIGAPLGDVAIEVWGPWARREEEFFVACDELASRLSWPDVVRVGGSELLATQQVALAALRASQDASLPARVRLGQVRIVGASPSTVRLQAYSFLDPLEVPRELFDVLHWFEGRPLEEALASASEAAGEAVPPAAIRMLLDHEILVPEPSSA